MQWVYHPTEIQNLKFTRGQQFEIEQYYFTEGAQIRKDYIQANRAQRQSKNELTKRRILENYKELKIVCDHSLMIRQMY